MNPLETDWVSLDNLMLGYYERAEKETTNMTRIKRFYDDEDSFDDLMIRIILKDYERFERLMNDGLLPNPWRVFFVVLDIVQHEGKVIPPYDVLTRMWPSRSMEYMGWTFSWVQGEATLISVYNREDELVYRF